MVLSVTKVFVPEGITALRELNGLLFALQVLTI
jgi:hypothetical protein